MRWSNESMGKEAIRVDGRVVNDGRMYSGGLTRVLNISYIMKKEITYGLQLDVSQAFE